MLNLARAMQGLGGAIVLPLTLTILSAAVPANKRGVALGAWGGISGLAVALGPVVGGAIAQGIAWQWIFWLNVPIGVALVPLAWSRLTESAARPASSTSVGWLVQRRPVRHRVGRRPWQHAGLGEHRDPRP